MWYLISRKFSPYSVDSSPVLTRCSMFPTTSETCWKLLFISSSSRRAWGRSGWISYSSRAYEVGKSKIKRISTKQNKNCFLYASIVIPGIEIQSIQTFEMGGSVVFQDVHTRTKNIFSRSSHWRGRTATDRFLKRIALPLTQPML